MTTIKKTFYCFIYFFTHIACIATSNEIDNRSSDSNKVCESDCCYVQSDRCTSEHAKHLYVCEDRRTQTILYLGGKKCFSLNESNYEFCCS